MPHRQLCFYRTQGNSPKATLIHVQGSTTLAHSYTPIVSGHLLVSIKGDVQGLLEKRERRGETRRTNVRCTNMRAEAGRVGETR
jgi:hypothetical protein